MIILMFSVLVAQESDTLVKYFPTDIQRSDVLYDEVPKEAVKGKAYFKSTYSPHGELLNVEYVPGGQNQKKLSGLKLFYGYWNPEKRTLAEGLIKDQLDGREYYEVRFNKKGRIKTVVYFNHRHQKWWSYHLWWNKNGTKSKYEIEFHLRQSLLNVDEFLFAHDLSEMRPGWRLEIKEREDGRPHTVIIQDKLGQVYYFYSFQYIDGKKKSRTKEIIISEYFRDDSSKVGMHKLFYNQKKFLFLAEYYNDKDSLLYTNSYDYSNAPKEILLTVKDGNGKLLEKRIIPFSNKYKRQLGPPKNKTGLADVISFLNKTSEEDLHQLVQSIESKFNVTVEMDTVVQKNTIITAQDKPVKKIVKLPEDKTPEAIDKKTRDQPFALGLYVGNKLISGQYMGTDNVMDFGLTLKIPFSFKMFWFSITPSLSYGQINFNGNAQSPVSWVTLESPDFVPLKFPLILHGAVGTVGPGFGIKGGIETKVHMGVDITLGTSMVIANDIDGKKQTTGYISGDVGVSYKLPF